MVEGQGIASRVVQGVSGALPLSSLNSGGRCSRQLRVSLIYLLVFLEPGDVLKLTETYSSYNKVNVELLVRFVTHIFEEVVL